MCGSDTSSVMPIEIRENESAIAAVVPLCSHDYLFNIQKPFFGHTCWWVTNWAMQLISIVSLCLEDDLHKNSPWSGTRIFGALMRMWGENVIKKWIFWVLLDVSTRSSRILKMFVDFRIHYDCARVSASKFQVLVRSGWRDTTFENLYPLSSLSSS